MSNLSDKVSYLRGLAEGLKVEDGTNEGRLIKQLIDVLAEAVEEIDELHEAFDELNDYVESIDDDLSELEDWDDDFDYDDEDEDDEDDDDFEDEEDDEDLVEYFDDDRDDDGASMYVGCICPKCHGMFCVDAYEDEDNQMYVCPHCNQTVEARPMDNDNVPIAKVFSEEPEED